MEHIMKNTINGKELLEKMYSIEVDVNIIYESSSFSNPLEFWDSARKLEMNGKIELGLNEIKFIGEEQKLSISVDNVVDMRLGENYLVMGVNTDVKIIILKFENNSYPQLMFKIINLVKNWYLGEEILEIIGSDEFLI